MWVNATSFLGAGDTTRLAPGGAGSRRAEGPSPQGAQRVSSPCRCVDPGAPGFGSSMWCGRYWHDSLLNQKCTLCGWGFLPLHKDTYLLLMAQGTVRCQSEPRPFL